MRQSPFRASMSSKSLQKFVCPNVDKTFPDLVERLRSKDSIKAGDTFMIATLRQYEKKFYNDEIKLLIQRVQKMNDKCKRQDREIHRLKMQLERQGLTRGTEGDIRENLDQLEATERLHGREEDSNHYLTARLKNHYLTQIDKIKNDYEKKLREIEREKANSCKALQFQNHYQMMELRFKQEQFKRQKEIQETQINSLREQVESLKNEGPKLEGIVELQSYKDENALLRSFIFKIKMAEQKLQQLESSRKKESQEFERLRIERNEIALENENLKQRNMRLTQELNILKERKGQQKQMMIASRFSQFGIPEVQSHIKEDDSKLKQTESRDAIFELEKALAKEEQKNRHLKEEYNVLQNYYKTRENSMKLTLEMSENSYQELWEKHCIVINNLKTQRLSKQDLGNIAEELSAKLRQNERQIIQIQKQRDLLLNESQMWKEKYETLKRQCEDYIKAGNQKDFIINDLKEKGQISKRDFEEMERTIDEIRNELKLASQNASRNYFKPITTLFPNPSDPNAETISHYQEQICQINAIHQNQIDHLKDYINELIEDNDQLRENYNEAAKSWRQMYEQVIKYNQRVDQGQMKLESSTNRKREIVEELEGLKMIKSEETQVYQPNRNDSEVFTVPDFSEKKFEEDNGPKREIIKMKEQFSFTEDHQAMI